MNDFSPSILDPQQESFAKAFLEDPSQRHHVLLAPSGMGKGRTARAIAHDVAATAEGAILVVTPTAVGRQFIHEAAAAGLPTLELTKARLRAIADGMEPALEPGTVAVIPPRALTDPWAADVVATVPWDLVVVDLDAFGGRETEVLQAITAGGKEPRVLVLVQSPRALEQINWLSDARVTEWRSNLLAAEDLPGAVLGRRFKPWFFDRDPAEEHVMAAVEEVLALSGPLTAALGLGQLRRAASSSDFALQSMALGLLERMRSLRNLTAHGHVPFPDEPLSGSMRAADQAQIVVATYAALEALVQEVDSLEHDSKYNALTDLVLGSAQLETKAGTVIFSALPATAAYIQSGLSLLGAPAFSVRAGKDELEQLDDRLRAGDIAVVSDSALQGIDLRSASQAINYDLMANRQRMHLRWARLNWTDPAALAGIWTLVPRQGVSSLEEQALQRMPYLTGDEATEPAAEQ